MAKFDSGAFFDCEEMYFAVSKKHSREEADRIFWEEIRESLDYYEVVNGYVQYGYGVDDDGYHQHGWWIHFREPSRNTHVPVYIYKRKEVK